MVNMSFPASKCRSTCVTSVLRDGANSVESFPAGVTGLSTAISFSHWVFGFIVPMAHELCCGTPMYLPTPRFDA